MRYFLCCVLCLSLAACDKPQPPKPPVTPTPAVKPQPAAALPALTVTADNWKKTKPNCRGENCPYIEVQLAQLSDKTLTALAEKTLVTMVGVDEKQPAFNTIAELSQYFWPKTEDNWNIYLQSKVLRQYKNVLVMQLDSETYSGGAHGFGVSRYLNINRDNNQLLALSDVLAAGQDEAFWALVQTQYQHWLKTNDLNDADQQTTWPFIKTDNFALTEQGLTVKYQSYDIAAYAFGQPEFTVPYAQLNGIVKPEFL